MGHLNRCFKVYTPNQNLSAFTENLPTFRTVFRYRSSFSVRSRLIFSLLTSIELFLHCLGVWLSSLFNSSFCCTYNCRWRVDLLIMIDSIYKIYRFFKDIHEIKNKSNETYIQVLPTHNRPIWGISSELRLIIGPYFSHFRELKLRLPELLWLSSYFIVPSTKTKSNCRSNVTKSIIT